MTVNELIEALGGAFPAFTPSAATVWGPVYRKALREHEGPALAAAFTETLTAFEPTPRKGYPSPMDFLACLPDKRLKLPSDGPVLDFVGRHERFRSLMAEWRRSQGDRGANGNREILRALEDIAWPLAMLAAWNPDAPPVRLTRAQFRLAQHRAISQERVRHHGMVPRDGAIWWAQIEAVALQWNIATSYDDWAAKSRQAAAA